MEILGGFKTSSCFLSSFQGSCNRWCLKTQISKPSIALAVKLFSVPKTATNTTCSQEETGVCMEV